jgi:Sporulation and spore germination
VRFQPGVQLILSDHLEGESMQRIIFPLLALALAIMASCNPYYPVPTQPVAPASVTLTVYFTDMPRYQVGTEPFEAAVTRTVPAPASLPEAVLTQLFLGPTESEKAQGLTVILSGTTGFSKLTIENGIAQVYLTGTCSSQGSTYTIANLIFANFKQFPEIQWIKIFDQNDETETPNGQTSSIPFCLEP